MKKRILIALAAILCLGALCAMGAGAATLEPTGILARQQAIDEALRQELEAGYAFEDACVILNPYGTSPLTAVIVFTTDEPTDVTIRVKGDSAENDMVGHFPEATEHLVPVYGLYGGRATTVELALGDGRETSFEVETEALSFSPGEIAVEAIKPELYDYSRITVMCGLGGALYGVDAAGDIRWYYNGGGTMGVHPLKNGHLMTPTAYTLKTSYYKSGLQEIDWTGRVYRDYEIPGGQRHDFQELDNGNLLVAGDPADFSSVEDYVVEIDRQTGEVVWELDLRDILPLGDGMSASMNTDGTKELDWFHNNSLWYDAKNDLVLLSGRHKDAIVAVRKSDKSLAWILGDPTDWNEVDPAYFFTPVGDDFEWFYAQHEITMLDNGDVMMFDNGTAKVKRSNDANRVTGSDVYSRAVIYRIDAEAMTVSQVFEYGKERGAAWYSDWISGVETLDGTDAALWITAGSHLYDPNADNHGLGPADMFLPDLVKSTHVDLVMDGELAYELTVTGDSFTALTFRSLRYPMYAEGMGLDIGEEAPVLGGLGETPRADADEAVLAALANASPEALPAGWSFTLDEVKLSFTGRYDTATAADALTPDYLVLRGDGEDRVYAVTSNAVAQEAGAAVSVNGWVSTEGLEGEWQILLCLDGQLYDTGYAL